MMLRPIFLALAIAAGILPGSANAQAPRGEQQAVVDVVRAFHDAIAQGDSLAALRLLAEDALILESGGLETRSDFRSHHLPADITFARAVPVQRADPVVTVVGDVAWVVSTSRTTGTLRDRPINSAGAELVVLTRAPAGWQIRAIHWSSRTIRSP